MSSRPQSRPRPALFLAVVTVFAAPVGAQAIVWSGAGDTADRFGFAVAGVGDTDLDGVPDFAVGAWGDTSGGVTGAVVVYSGATLTERYRLHADGVGDRFGHAVAGAGDVNGDGFADVIVGAPRYQVGSDPVGRARVHSGRDGALLFAFDGSSEQTGWAVAGAGDVNADGHADVVVGAPSTAHAQSTVRVLSGLDGAVLLELSYPNAEELGWAVAGGGDVDGDGVPDVVIGAPEDGAGRVRAVSGADGSVLLLVDPVSGEFRLGAAVAMLGDVDGDGRADFAVGAPEANWPGADSGAVRVISGATGATLWRVDGEAPRDRLGFALAAAGDVDGDGVSDLVVGVPGADSAGEDAGQARVLSGVDGALLAVVRGSSAGDELGTAVGGVGDLTGDGVPEIVVGAPYDGSTGLLAGSARVVDVFLDCDGNGLHDGREIADGTSPDCNANGRPDVCDITSGASEDCDGDGVPDDCAIAAGGSDCNENGVLDACDILTRTSTDCDADGVPDECQVPPPAFADLSPVYAGLFHGTVHVRVIPAPPLPAGDVLLSATGRGDLGSPGEYVIVRLNGAFVGQLFSGPLSDCTELEDELVVPRATWLGLVGGGDAVLELVPSSSVMGCPGSWIQLRTSYELPPGQDCNRNGVPDECDVVSGASADADGDGVPDECAFETYCQAASNSTGAAAQMAWSGSSSVSANELVLLAAPLPPAVNGLFVYAAAPGYTPLGDGFLCLDPSVQGFVNRLPFETSNAAGTMLHALDVTAPPVPESLITPGSTWYFTCWFRDPAAGGAGFNFANGLRVGFQP